MDEKRVLFIRHAAFGDVLLTTPFLSHLHQERGSLVDLYTLHGDAWSPHPGLGRVIAMKLKSLPDVLKRNYDEVYWFSYEHNPFLHILDGYELSTGLHPAERVLSWSVTPQEAPAADLLKDLPRPIVGIHPVSPLPERSITLALCQDLIDRIHREVGGSVVVTGHKPLALNNCTDVSGRTGSLRNLGALMAGMDAFISIDSGPFHIAQALGIPTVGLFGCSLPELRATRYSSLHVVRVESLPCLGCYHEIPPGQEALGGCARGDRACMEALDPGRIVKALRDVMAGVEDEALRERAEAYEAKRPAMMAGMGDQHASAVSSYKKMMYAQDRKLGGLKRLRRRLGAFFKRHA